MSQWNGIVGHDWAVELLQAAVAHGRVGHAYLFTGADHIGKTTVARTFAQALNCEVDDAEGRPCGRCRSCRLIAADRHPDVKVLAPTLTSRGRPTLKIDAIRDLQSALSLTANEARYQVAIVRQFDAATIGAANAFLKTLEEPPDQVVLLLTARDADALLPTIQSRCRTVALRPMTVPDLAAALAERREVPAEQANLLARLANGRYGWAERALEEPERLVEREGQLARLYEALDGNRIARFAIAEEVARHAETLPALLTTWLGWWRDLVILSTYTAEVGLAAVSNIDQLGRLSPLAQRLSRETAVRGLQQTDRALWQLARNANARLVVENLLLSYPD